MISISPIRAGGKLVKFPAISYYSIAGVGIGFPVHRFHQLYYGTIVHALVFKFVNEILHDNHSKI